MRPGQQNKRGRGRGGSNNNNGGGGGGNNNFNRKGGNPLTRTYDSSGPDVKIRGTAQHIAEKYSTLARDSHSAGDRVMAENYLQHAEHYNRIIATAQAQMQERFQRDERGEYQDRDGQDGDDNDNNEMDDDGNGHGNGNGRPQHASETQPQPQQPQQSQPRREQQPRREPRREQAPVAPSPEAASAPAPDGSGPQPVIEGTPAEVAAEEGTGETRQPRRRNAGNRPRRTRRGEGDAPSEGGSDDGQPEMADVAGE